MKHEEPDCINTEYIDHIVSVHYVALRLTHLAITLEEPRMTEYLLWKRKSECHQHDRPVNGMESQDILADQVKICRPVFIKLLIALSIYVISKSSYVV